MRRVGSSYVLDILSQATRCDNLYTQHFCQIIIAFLFILLNSLIGRDSHGPVILRLYAVMNQVYLLAICGCFFISLKNCY